MNERSLGRMSGATRLPSVASNVSRAFRALILATILVSGSAWSAEEAAVEIVRAEFGTFDASNPRETLFAPTSIVPHKQGQRYGWIIEVRTGRRSLSVREEYLLPNPAKDQQTTESSRETLIIPFDRHNQVSQRQLVPVDGKIYGDWAIGPGEPAGHRHLQVVIEGQVAADFEYDVK